MASFRHAVWKWRIANDGILDVLKYVITAKYPDRCNGEDDRYRTDNNPDPDCIRPTGPQHWIGLLSHQGCLPEEGSRKTIVHVPILAARRALRFFRQRR